MPRAKIGFSSLKFIIILSKKKREIVAKANRSGCAALILHDRLSCIIKIAT